MLTRVRAGSLFLLTFSMFLAFISIGFSEIIEYPCYRLAEEPLLDGMPDPVWDTIPQTEGFVVLNTDTFSSKRTIFKVGYNETALSLQRDLK